jgi:hypothetical protein
MQPMSPGLCCSGWGASSYVTNEWPDDGLRYLIYVVLVSLLWPVFASSAEPVTVSPETLKAMAARVRQLVEEFGRPSNYRSEQFATTSAFEAALRSGTELIGTIVACA